MDKTKTKISTGLGAVMLVACMFAGWQTLLIVSILMLIYVDIDEKLKDVMIKVITFYAALTIFSWVWGLIPEAVTLIKELLDNVIKIINGYLDYTNQIDLGKFYLYVLNPITEIVKMANEVVSYLITMAKVLFIAGIFTGKALKPNPVTNKISDMLTKVVNYMNSFGTPAPAAAPAATPAPEAPVASTPVQ